MGKLPDSIARDIASPAVKMGNRSLFSVAPCRLLSLVLSFAPKESTIPRRGGSPSVRAGVGASIPRQEKGFAPAGAPKGFPRGKQSARFALPCAPLVVCLNDRSLTAFGGCIHWIPASLRSPLETFGPEGWQSFPMELQAPPPASQSARQALGGNFLQQSWLLPPLAQMKRTLPVIKPARFFTPQSLPF